ncbi:MAG: RNA polymerase sigma factor [Spirochaetia bacterium]
MQREDESTGFKRIYNETFPLLMSIAYHMTGDRTISEDLCQEAFVRYYERQDNFPDFDQARYWLIRVLKNLTLNYEKRKTREGNANRRFHLEPKRNPEASYSDTLKEETKQLVRSALDRLPVKLRTPLVLREYGDLSYKEIASIMHITEANVKVRVYRAREAVSQMIEKGEIYVPE